MSRPPLSSVPIIDKRATCATCQGAGTLFRFNGDWLRYHRLRAGLSMRGAAKKLGISASHVHDIEAGKRFPSQSLFLRIKTRCPLWA